MDNAVEVHRHSSSSEVKVTTRVDQILSNGRGMPSTAFHRILSTLCLKKNDSDVAHYNFDTD